MSQTFNVYLVMTDLGVGGVFGSKANADERAAYMQTKYLAHHWVETWEVKKW